MIRIVLFLVFLFSGAANGASLSGYIKDKTGGEPIPGATVFLPDINRGTVANASGFFVLKDVPQGLLKVKVSSIGFDAVLTQLMIKGETSLDFLLMPAQIKMKEVVVSAGAAAVKEETPYQIESITSKEIFSGGDISIPAALSRVPGINQIGYGPGIGKPVIRGMSFSRVLTVYQGSRFENQQWGEDHGLGLNDPGIEGIEIIKGPASLIYGSGALGGVINIIDEYPAAPGSVKVDFMQNLYSNTLGSKTSLGVKGAGENGVFWSFRGGKDSHADYRSGGGRTIGNSRFNTLSGKGTMGFAKGRSTAKLSYVYFQQNLGIIEEDEMQNSMATTRTDRRIQLPYQNVTDHLLSFQYLLSLKKGVLKLNVSSHTNFRKEIEEDFDETDLGLVLNTNNFDLRYIFNLNESTELITGVQSFIQSNKNMPGASEILIPNAKVNDFSGFVLANKKAGKMNLSGGLRYDYRITGATSPDVLRYVLPGDSENSRMSRTFTGISGSVGFTAALSDHWNFKTNLASGFRAPDLAELFSNGEHPGTNRFEKGNATFDREQNLGIDAGVLFRNAEFSAEAGTFYNHINNYIFFSPTLRSINNLTVWEFRQEDVILKGGEISMKASPSALKFLEAGADYSLVHASKAVSGRPVPQIPANRVNAYVKIKLAKDFPVYWNLQSRFVFNQNRFDQNEEMTPGYQVLNSGIQATFIILKYSVEAGFNVNNLLDRMYFEHQSVTRAFGVPDLGRNIAINIRCKF
jgi:iron complex outermembrane recepter protein